MKELDDAALTGPSDEDVEVPSWLTGRNCKSNSGAVTRRAIGKRLREVIKRYGLTLQLVAKETGIDIITLRNMGRSAMQTRTIDSLCNYLQKVARTRRSLRE